MKNVEYPGITLSPKEFLMGCPVLCPIGKSEAEEMANRILRFCLKLNRWVAPTWKELEEQIDSDFEALRKDSEVRRQNRQKKERYEKLAKWNWLLRIFGHEVPEPKYEDVQEYQFIWPSMLAVPEYPMRGLSYLTAHGFVELISEEDGTTFNFKLTEKFFDLLQ